jgi:hypothetical protein
MAGIARVVSLLKALGLVSWRDIRSLGSIAGQNFFFFVLFVALQPESAEFFLLLLLVVLLFPLSTDPMEMIPLERRLSWPVVSWEWSVVRFVSVLLSPVVWVGLALLVKLGWRAGAIVAGAGVCLYTLKQLGKRWASALAGKWPYRIPAPPGAIGAIMRLQWRAMLHTLDPYFAITLMTVTELYRISGRVLDPSAPRIMSLLVVLALSTEAQVLFGIDGHGADRYRQLPIRGWQILLAKDLAFLLMVGLLVWPLDLLSGLFGGVAALTVGHHNSVFKPVSQGRWRFTSGALFPHGVLQTIALFSVGNVVRTEGLPFASACLAAWIGSLVFYGWKWDGGAL